VLFAAIAIGLGIVVPRPFLSSAGADREAGESRAFLVLSSAIHTDLAFPADDPDVRAALGFIAGEGLDPDLPGARYVIAGWGSRAFYINTPTWGDLKPGPLARALTVDSAVMHMVLAGDIDRESPSVRSVTVSRAQWRALLEAVSASFVRDGQGDVLPIPGAEYGDFDRFYEAHGWFNAAVGCNTWTGRMLREAGVTTGAWTALPVFLSWSLDLHGN
jgi:uncharacterized protein (TIGR02117 family)